jgi:hypothetical protein
MNVGGEVGTRSWNDMQTCGGAFMGGWGHAWAEPERVTCIRTFFAV